ncbi:MAG: hypothetical protein K0Q49_1654 [Haloplasmataceae bacterium]|jgi:hypothetical protein|nr:hypothetical protein [Haloplasmataceae bacterium]
MINNVPINGYVYQYIGDRKAHIHKIEIDDINEHRRYYSGYTSFNLGHRHSYSGLTEPGLSNIDHTHRYFMFTSLENGHKHIITGSTSKAIRLPNGEHYHILNGFTSKAGEILHVHSYIGRTLV